MRGADADKYLYMDPEKQAAVTLSTNSSLRVVSEQPWNLIKIITEYVHRFRLGARQKCSSSLIPSHS